MMKINIKEFMLCFHFSRIKILIIYFSTITFSINSEESLILKGKLIDTALCFENRLFSYSLYLPTKYSDSLKWPVIFSFDPGSNGSRAIINFIPVAEKYGYILAGSNNSANGNPRSYNLEAAKNMISDVEKRFNINLKRKYTSGFSGGSRVASLVAIELKGIAAVIGCGAGFPGLDQIPNYLSFDYIGIVGNRDMNLLEMIELEEYIKKSSSQFEIRIFNGGHQWPGTIEMDDAIEWLLVFWREIKSLLS